MTLALRLLAFLPASLGLWVQRIAPEWFLPPRLILKCQKGIDVEHGDEDDFNQLFEAEYRAYEHLKCIQGVTIPRCHGLTDHDGRRALLLESIPGAALAEPEGAILSFEEAKRLLKICYDGFSQNGALQEDDNISNFILATDKQRIIAVDLEYVKVDSSPEDIEYHNMLSMQTTLRAYLHQQRFLRQDGYLETA